MTPTNSVALLFFRVLADPRGRPAALLLECGAGDHGALAAAIGAGVDNFVALSAAMPCLFRHDALAAPLAEALQQQRWRALAPAAVCRVDQRLVIDALPAAIAWLDGDWCMTPPPTATGAQAASRATALQMVQLVADDADTHAIEALLRRDPALSYNLLRLVNSIGVGGGRRITSFSQALLLLGRGQLRRWLNLMLFAARQGDIRSTMLLARVAMRARALELLAKVHGLDKLHQEQAFMTGMFSLLGVLFGMTVAEVLAPLCLGEAVHAALLRREGELGILLSLIEALEQGDLAGAAVRLDALQIARADFNDAIIDAALWMQGALQESQAAHG
ncbi:EAL and HDOD domain-containing protein [Massilia sp. PWRC2]|uniref:EAL and HDOD domain-containing protein n=1 Tax=Massilia sp. PWRC2 TaxID=2804626 RepID=UPI003CFB138C